jgi:hypothetical protein
MVLVSGTVASLCSILICHNYACEVSYNIRIYLDKLNAYVKVEESNPISKRIYNQRNALLNEVVAPG